MRAHISLSKHRCLHDLLVISLGKIRQSDPKYFPIAAARYLTGRPIARRDAALASSDVSSPAYLHRGIGHARWEGRFFHELKHSFDMPKSTLNAPTMRTHAFKQEIQTVAGRSTLLRPESLAALLLMITMALIVVSHRFQFSCIIDASLYPQDGRRPFTELDENRYPGAGVLMCFSEFGTLECAAAAWLIGSPVVVLNAHNFVDRKLVPTRSVTDPSPHQGE